MSANLGTVSGDARAPKGLCDIARAKRMSHVARDAGLSSMPLADSEGFEP